MVAVVVVVVAVVVGMQDIESGGRSGDGLDMSDMIAFRAGG